MDVVVEAAQRFYDGLTILGGEPFEKENQPEVAALIARVKKEIPGRDIWMYTGFTYEEDLVPGGCRYTEHTDFILDNIDVLVDGRFVLALRNLMLNFRGSENQRLLAMRATRKEGRPVLSPLM